MKKIKYISDAIDEFLIDLKSYRVVLCWVAFMFNTLVLFISPDNLKYSIVLLTAVFAFYFTSKHHEHKSKEIIGEDPPYSGVEDE